MTTLLGETRPVARKRHHCDECGAIIAVGVAYVRQRNVRDGEAYTYKAHEECHSVAVEVASMWDDSTPLTDWPEDELREAAGQAAEVVIRRKYAAGVEHYARTIRKAVDEALSATTVDVPACVVESGFFCGDDPCCCGEATLTICPCCGSGGGVSPRDHDSECPRVEPLRRLRAALRYLHGMAEEMAR